MVSRWRDLCGRACASHVPVASIVGSLFVGAYVLVLVLIPPPDVLTSVVAQTELIRFEDPAGMAAFPVYGMRAVDDSGSSPTIDGQCVDGLISPNPAARISYGRVGGGGVEIRLIRSPSAPQSMGPVIATYEAREAGTALPIRGPLFLAWDARCVREHQAALPDALGEDKPPPLPVWGQVVLGGEFKPIRVAGMPEPRMLLSGEMQISARSVGWLGPPTLYHAGAEVLPVGSRLEAETDGVGYGPGERPNWWGTVVVSPDQPALSVMLATDTHRFRLFHANQDKADIITVSGLTQLIDDPAIRRGHLVLAGLTLVPLVFKFFSWAYDLRGWGRRR